MRLLEILALAGHLVCAALVARWLWPRALAAPALRVSVVLALAFGSAAASAFWQLRLVPGWDPRWQLAEVGVGVVAIAAWLAARRRTASRAAAPPSERESVLATGVASAPSLATRRLTWFVAGLGALFLAQLALRACASPTGSYDAAANWNLRARAFFLAGERMREFIADQPGIVHSSYPALIPLLVARLWRACGEASTVVPMLLGALYATATVVAVGSAVAAKRGPRVGLLAAALLLATPDLPRQAVAQLADVPVGLAFALAGLFLWLALEARDLTVRTWALCGALLGVAMWTKNEGTLFTLLFVAIGASVGLRRDGWRAAVRLVVGLAAGMLPFVVTLQAYKSCVPTANELLPWGRADAVVGLVLDVERWKIVLSEIGPRVLDFGHFLFPTTVVAVFVARRYTPAERPALTSSLVALAALPVSMLLGHVAVALTTPYPLAFHIQSTQNRLLLQLWPLVVAALCALVPAKPR